MAKSSSQMILRSSTLFALIALGILFIWKSSAGPSLEASSLDFQDFGAPVEFDSKNSFMLGGVQMNEGDLGKWVETLRSSGMNTVEVTVYAHQGRWNENNLWYYEYEAGVLEEIRMAKAAGLQVALILRLQLDHSFPDNKFLWHGMVYPENEYLLHRWFEEYGQFAKKWALVSEAEGVDLLVLGSELNALFSSSLVDEVPNLEEYYLNKAKQSAYHRRMLKFKDRLPPSQLSVYGARNYTDLGKYLEDQSDCKRRWAEKVACVDSADQVLAINKRRATHNYYWETLIADIRGKYKGKMTIAANFDNYQDVAFWDKLDYIGINAYFPLQEAVGRGNGQKAFERSWEGILGGIREFQDSMGIGDLPVLFTELGYADHAGATIRPWQGSGFSLLKNGLGDSLVIWEAQPDAASERNAAVNALHEVVQRENFPLAGILYWKFTTQAEQLAYDPFALHIGPGSRDSMQRILLKFRE